VAILGSRGLHLFEADPSVRAGPPGPAVSWKNQLLSQHRTTGRCADCGYGTLWGSLSRLPPGFLPGACRLESRARPGIARPSPVSLWQARLTNSTTTVGRPFPACWRSCSNREGTRLAHSDSARRGLKSITGPEMCRPTEANGWSKRPPQGHHSLRTRFRSQAPSLRCPIPLRPESLQPARTGFTPSPPQPAHRQTP